MLSITALSCWTVFSCNDADNGDTAEADDTGSTQSSAQDTSTLRAATPPDSGTVMFMTKAASGGTLEVQLGQLALRQGSNQRVKDFGAMMVRDHGKANDELKGIASSKNVTLSDSLMPEHKKHLQHLQNRKGAAFDKEYMSMMVEDHQKDVGEFEKASNNLADGEVKAFATRTLPTLRAHLDSAKNVNSGLKK